MNNRHTNKLMVAGGVLGAALCAAFANKKNSHPLKKALVTTALCGVGYVTGEVLTALNIFFPEVFIFPTAALTVYASNRLLANSRESERE